MWYLISSKSVHLKLSSFGSDDDDFIHSHEIAQKCTNTPVFKNLNFDETAALHSNSEIDVSNKLVNYNLAGGNIYGQFGEFGIPLNVAGHLILIGILFWFNIFQPLPLLL